MRCIIWLVRLDMLAVAKRFSSERGRWPRDRGELVRWLARFKFRDCVGVVNGDWFIGDDGATGYMRRAEIVSEFALCDQSELAAFV